jgi:hypothetical protein
MTGVERIAAERKRQIDKEGWDAAHDDDHIDGSLLDAAIGYAAAPSDLYRQTEGASGRGSLLFETVWPRRWNAEWDKREMRDPTDAQRIRMLEKAGALIAAEIDRLLRLPAG